MENVTIFLLLFAFINDICSISIDPKNIKKFFSNVLIDTNGDFKYIMIEMVNNYNLNDVTYLLRGFNKFNYHRQIYMDFMQNNVYKYPEINKNYRFKVLGGGRINFNGNNVKIYGYSGLYGTYNHKHTAYLIQQKYPTYNITT